MHQAVAAGFLTWMCWIVWLAAWTQSWRSKRTSVGCLKCTVSRTVGYAQSWNSYVYAKASVADYIQLEQAMYPLIALVKYLALLSGRPEVACLNPCSRAYSV